ncbi:hypothetical protein K466DRAFT_591427 [Polyporus arcularius HHB13444]|uniref:Uncharacterized protein n=1 Tax=Polyporus arcularius HHB13444 TaxID=1314778 RepID=A0A5C3NUY5_9APHY|nr:hypothetical protein K466DRAFT_591427 [Polyporus arcularius HHB13444]
MLGRGVLVRKRDAVQAFCAVRSTTRCPGSVREPTRDIESSVREPPTHDVQTQLETVACNPANVDNARTHTDAEAPWWNRSGVARIHGRERLLQGIAPPPRLCKDVTPNPNWRYARRLSTTLLTCGASNQALSEYKQYMQVHDSRERTGSERLLSG